MVRRTIQTMIIAAALALLLGGTATAFTFRLGPVAGTPSPVTAESESDLPTPQLFQVGIGQGGVVWGVTPHGTVTPAHVQAVHLQDTLTPEPLPSQAAQQVHDERVPRRLSGAELLLLRQTAIVAGQHSQ